MIQSFAIWSAPPKPAIDLKMQRPCVRAYLPPFGRQEHQRQANNRPAPPRSQSDTSQWQAAVMIRKPVGRRPWNTRENVGACRLLGCSIEMVGRSVGQQNDFAYHKHSRAVRFKMSRMGSLINSNFQYVFFCSTTVDRINGCVRMCQEL